MIINPGIQQRVINETTLQAGVTSQDGSILTDALLASLYVSSVTSGTLDVSVYTLTDTGREVLLLSFPIISAGTTSLLLRKSGVSLQRFRIQATYTGVCSYEVYVRAINNAGESSSRVLGQNSIDVQQITVPTSPTLLIASALVDRAGLIIRNWNTTGVLYVAENSGKANSSVGYPINAQETLSIDIASGVELYGIASSGTVDVRIMEAGG